MEVQTVLEWGSKITQVILEQVTSPPFYAQGGIIVLAVILSLSLTFILRKRSPLFHQPPQQGPLYPLRKSLYGLNDLLFPFFNILALSIGVELSTLAIQQSWLVRIAESAAVIFLIYSVIARFVHSPVIRQLIKWIAIPIALLQVFGWLDEVISYLDSLTLEVGNIKLSAYGLVRVTIFGLLLFWIGRLTNNTGQRLIRNRQELDSGTREIFAKLLQVAVFFVVFLLLLQIMGINLTTLAVFGGALGVGLGFGLQSIASNFISGIIILLDRSLTVGDYVELEDGKAGTIREMNMRSTTLETFDGKDVMVPNEKFITSQFINWTHKNKRQRYSLEFSVAYHTDLHALFKLIRKVVATHPQVLSGPDYPLEEQPDAEIQGFGDSGVDILVEFWMDAIDDGNNRVGGDLLLMLWDAFKEHGIEFPFPQREVRIIGSLADKGDVYAG